MVASLQVPQSSEDKQFPEPAKAQSTQDQTLPKMKQSFIS